MQKTCEFDRAYSSIARDSPEDVMSLETLAHRRQLGSTGVTARLRGKAAGRQDLSPGRARCPDGECGKPWLVDHWYGT
jgi:hypothetical protein